MTYIIVRVSQTNTLVLEKLENVECTSHPTHLYSGTTDVFCTVTDLCSLKTGMGEICDP